MVFWREAWWGIKIRTVEQLAAPPLAHAPAKSKRMAWLCVGAKRGWGYKRAHGGSSLSEAWWGIKGARWNYSEPPPVLPFPIPLPLSLGAWPGGVLARSLMGKKGCMVEQIRKTQDEPQWIVAQRLLSALTIPGFS